MTKRNSIFKIILISLSIITIISLVYLKFILIGSSDGMAYFPFYKSMTFLDYAETTVPGLIEFVAFICIVITYLFVAISRFSKNDRYIYLFLGIFEAIVLLILITNMITFKIINQNIQVLPGPALYILILNTIVSIVYGVFPTNRKKTIEEPKTVAVVPGNIRPVAEVLKDKRESADFTQQKLADAIMVTRQTVNRWESGRSHPDMEYMIQVAQTLSFPVSDFWGEDNGQQMNDEFGTVVKRGKIYQQAAYFLLSIFIVIGAVFAVAYIGKNQQSPSLDRINPFIQEEVGYVLVNKSGKQKAAVVDNDYGKGNIVTINGTYDNKTEFVKVVHKGAYVRYEVRNINRDKVPEPVRNNLYQISHFNDPKTGLQKLQLSYTKRYI